LTLLICSAFLSGCAKSTIIGGGKRPWLPVIPAFTQQERDELAAQRKNNPAMEKLQRNYVAYKAMAAVYMKDAYAANCRVLIEIGWIKSDAEESLDNQLVKAGYSDDQILVIKE